MKPGSSNPGFSRIGDELVLRVREKAVEGAANDACVKAIALELHIAPSRVRLIQGGHSPFKSFNVEGVGAEQLAAVGCGP
ncbi:MAG: DUF167 domain-containing protein [Candidatus Aquilonibacter sp.]